MTERRVPLDSPKELPPVVEQILKKDAYISEQDLEWLQFLYSYLRGTEIVFAREELNDTLEFGFIYLIRRDDHTTGYLGQIIATATAHFLPHSFDKYTVITAFVTHPDFLCMGLGKRIWSMMRAHLSDPIFYPYNRRFELHCDTSNPARREAYNMYLALGFEPKPERMELRVSD